MEFFEIQAFEEKKNALFYIVNHLIYTIPTSEALSLGLDLTDEEKDEEYVNVYYAGETSLGKLAFEKVNATSSYLTKKQIHNIYFDIIKFTEDNKEDIIKFAPTKNRH